MAVFNEPQKWAQTLGKDADVTTIPDTAGDTDPSIDKIFPSVFSIPLAQGGKAIPRSVLNGLFKLLGDNIFYLQQGGVFSYSDTANYGRGAFVKYNNELYLCIQDNSSLNKHAPTDAKYWLRVALNNDLANYLPLAGGNLTGNLTVQNKNVVRSVNGVNADADGNVNVIVDYKNDTNGYIQFSNGLILAWSTIVIENKVTVINKPKPFTTLHAYVTDNVASRTSQINRQAWVVYESTNTTDAFASDYNISTSTDGASIFWIGKV